MRSSFERSDRFITSIRRRTGFSIIEVLVALLIAVMSVFIMISLLTFCLRVDHTSSRIAENLRISTGLIESGEASKTTISIEIDGVTIPGSLIKSEYGLDGSGKKLIEFVRDNL
ncbi:MAG TPA: hypothetical protein DCE14_05740 [Kosmotogaceae bacterium]|nr:MAG: Uncharacterized protein XE05_1393 [Thermotogales bacterium 46_20]HAA85838.1 hypothetical protein [Kosmotogaceae bacterium]